jgi:hypothetical protein
MADISRSSLGARFPLRPALSPRAPDQAVALLFFDVRQFFRPGPSSHRFEMRQRPSRDIIKHITEFEIREFFTPSAADLRAIRVDSNKRSRVALTSRERMRLLRRRRDPLRPSAPLGHSFLTEAPRCQGEISGNKM